MSILQYKYLAGLFHDDNLAVSDCSGFKLYMETYPKYISLMQGQLPLLLLMSESSVTITVKLFAAYQEAYGVPDLIREFPSQTPVSAVLDALIAEHPKLEQWRNLTRFGVNLQFVDPDTILQNGDEVVLIPPVSGG